MELKITVATLRCDGCKVPIKDIYPIKELNFQLCAICYPIMSAMYAPEIAFRHNHSQREKRIQAMIVFADLYIQEIVYILDLHQNFIVLDILHWNGFSIFDLSDDLFEHLYLVYYLVNKDLEQLERDKQLTDIGIKVIELPRV